jgi:archaemetzincin
MRSIGSAQRAAAAVLAWILAASITAVDFTPPDAKQREQALGSLDGLPPALRAAFAPDAFAEMVKPGRSDWLASFEEPGQSFAEFKHQRHARPDEKRRTIYLRPIGAFAEGRSPSLDRLQRWVGAYFMLPVAQLPPLEVPAGAFGERTNGSTGKPQLLTTALLDELQRGLPKDGFVLVGVTMADLYPDPTWNFVFGQAQPEQHVGVFSFARYGLPGSAPLPPDAALRQLERSCHVLSHEIGHLFGIEHCIWYRCCMNGCNHLAEMDSQPMRDCPVDLRKLQDAVGFDALERYRKLDALCGEFGFDEEKRWIDGEIERIGAATKP